jgi:hypothetical protein
MCRTGRTMFRSSHPILKLCAKFSLRSNCQPNGLDQATLAFRSFLQPTDPASSSFPANSALALQPQRPETSSLTDNVQQKRGFAVERRMP